jgi:hypothetical protein
MAKKEKIGPVSAGEDSSHRSANIVTPPSALTSQSAQVGASASSPTAAGSPAQMENAMVRQILERQAVFGF